MSFAQKLGCSKVYFLIELLKKMFSTIAILDMKNPFKVQIIFSQNSTKDRMTHFNISFAVKRRWQWSALFRIFRNVKPLPMFLTNIKFSV